MRPKTLVALACAMVAAVAVSSTHGKDYRGTVRAGYTFTDIVGNRGVHQPTYNLYEGPAFSVDRFQYQWASGLNLEATVLNPFRNDRRWVIGLNKSGLGGLTFNHNNYRRVYDFGGDAFTRRRATSGSAWFRPVRQLKLFAGYGITDRAGRRIDLFEPAGSPGADSSDYRHQLYNAGFEIKHERIYGRLDYHATDFNDNMKRLGDRKSERLRLNLYGPLPSIENVVVGAGFQSFRNRFTDRSDSLVANTVWASTRYTHREGYEVRYSAVFDRARRTGDLTATDNIVHAVGAGKTWRNHGGFLLGCTYRVNDDALVECSGEGFSASGWLAPVEHLIMRAGMGLETDAVESGRTLTGDREHDRHWLSAKYTVPQGFLDLKIEDHCRDNDDTGSRVRLFRVTQDAGLTSDRFGDLRVSYAYGDGEYENTAGVFDYGEHVVSGEALSREFQRVQAGLGGTYYRSRLDVDVEAFTITLKGRCRVRSNLAVEIIYSAHNFDNIADLAEDYSEYYTANVVEASFVFEL